MKLKLNSPITFVITLLLPLVFSQCASRPDQEGNTALRDACEYLWKTQSPDGGWHSETHGILRSGESLTPFIFVALMNVSNDIYRPSAINIDRAKDFIRKNVRHKINTDSIPKILDYPNYSAAFALKTLAGSKFPGDSMLVSYLTTYLLDQQFAEQRGIDSLHPAYGGWGYGEIGLKDGQTGHVDISHTRRVLEALRMTLPSGHPAFRKAQQYLSRVQNDAVPADTLPEYLDGGFFTSLVTPETNKSHPVSEVKDTWHSYATATCDGLLALNAAGVPHDDMRMRQASSWLIENHEVKFPQGIPLDDPLQWHLVMKYYHLAVRAETCPLVHYKDVNNEISAILISEQHEDGSFINPMGAPNKEDDPLLATAFAVIALSHANYTLYCGN